MSARPAGSPMQARVRAALAKVHVARKELGLTEEDYRAIVLRITRHASLAGAPLPAVEAVVAEMRRLGWDGGQRKFRPHPKAHVRKVYALWRELAPHLGSGGSKKALRSFVSRQTRSEERPDGVAAPEFLTADEAGAVIEGLKAWHARVRREVLGTREGNEGEDR